MKFRALGWLAVAGLVAGALAGPMAGTAGAALNGAIWTSLSDGTSVNANIYDAKGDVYLNGGPQNCGNGNGLPDGDYYFQVTNPSGGELLSTDAIKFRQVQVVDGVIAGVSGSGNHAEGTQGCNSGTPVQLIPYNDTPNNGGEYSVDLAPVAAVQACEGFDADTPFNFLDCNTDSKNDNFKVGEEEPTPTPTPEPTPTPTPTPEPTPTPTPEPTPTPPGPGVIDVVKILDVDGDLGTDDDQTFVTGWTFDVAVTGGTPSADSITTADQAGGDVPFAEVEVNVDGASAAVTLTENQQEGFEIVDAFCFNDETDFGTLDGLALSFDIGADEGALCVFYNTGGGVEAATGTPAVTPPPTDAVSSTDSSGEGTRLLLLVIAGIIATMLVVTPAPARRRR